MNLRFGLIVSLFLFVSTLGIARDANMERGGLGFIFPDHNSFSNPGQFATSHGIAAQALFSSDTKVSQGETADANVVFGNGMFGLGVDAARFAPNVMQTNGALDTVTAAGGVSLIKERLTVGGSYSRVISSLGSGIGEAEGTITLNSPNRHGPSIGFGYTTTVSSPVKKQGLIGGVGYAFHSNNSIEANVKFNDTTNWKDYDTAAYFTAAGNMVYAGGGYIFHGLLSQHELAGRLGVMLGMRFDISAKVGYTFVSGNPIDYGATARFSF